MVSVDLVKVLLLVAFVNPLKCRLRELIRERLTHVDLIFHRTRFHPVETL